MLIRSLFCTLALLNSFYGHAAQTEEVVKELESWDVRSRSVVIKDESAPEGYSLMGMGLSLPDDAHSPYKAPRIIFAMNSPLKTYQYRWDSPAPETITPLPRITYLSFSLNGKPFSRTRFDDISNRFGWMKYQIEVPIVPQSVSLTVQFTAKSSQIFRLQSRQPVPPAPQSDARLAPQENGFAYQQLLEIGKPDEASAVLTLQKRQNLGGFIYSNGCRATHKSGPVVRTRLVLKRHARYAPDGDLTLHETEYLQPVYRTYEQLYPTSKVVMVSYELYDESTMTTLFECLTRSGQKLSQELVVPNAYVWHYFKAPTVEQRVHFN